jgi:hypothetical protein
MDDRYVGDWPDEVAGVPIVSPSMGRAGNVMTLKLIPSLILAVPQREERLYRVAHPSARVLPVPDEVVGLAATRQWCWDYFGDLFFVDDDIRDVFNNWHTTSYAISTEEIYAAIRSTRQTAIDFGVHLWGFGHFTPMTYRPYQPFRVTGSVWAYSMGLFKGRDEFRFDPNHSLSEDLYISGLNAHYYRNVFVDNRWGFTPHRSSKEKGGCSTYRTIDRERENFEFLRRMFGESIALAIDEKGNQKARTVHSQWGRVLRVPF